MKQKQHYISKILTKPWEIPNSGRHVEYFDWDKNQIIESSTKNLFSKINLWPQAYETIFNSKFERRLEADIETIIFGRPKRDIETSSKAIRSILILHHFNAMRSMRAHWGLDDIDRFSKLKLKDINEEIEFFAKEYVFIALPLGPQYYYFFPESAFFRIPLFNNALNEMDFGFAIPLHPRYSLGIFPKDFNRTEARKITDSILVALSIGSAFDKRIILPPSYISKNPNIKLIDSIKAAKLENIHDLNFVMENSESLKRRREIVIENRKNR